MDSGDQGGQQLIPALIGRVCSRTSPALDTALLSGIKKLCRQSDENVALAWEALWGHLRAPHAQTRLLALLVCEQLFSRSRAFRQALLSRLSQVLEAVIGFRSGHPLPPPASSAAALREKALQLLEAWNQEHGRYKQLPLAVRYLRDTLQYRFPEIATRAAAAEAEQSAQEERERAALRVRWAALLAPGGGWQEGREAAAELLTEMGECFAILDERPQPSHQQQQQVVGSGQQQQQQQQELQQKGQEQPPDAQGREGAMPEAVAVVGGLEWEDVATEAAALPTAADAAVGEQEGLEAYAATAAADAEGAAEAAGGSSAAELEVVLETLAGLYRQLTSRVLPQVQDWLAVLGRVEPEGLQQEQARQAMLRSATELRGRLVAARERCDVASLDLEALLLQRRRREEQRRQQEDEQQAAVAAAVQDLFGDSNGSRGSRGSSSSDGGEAEGRQQARRKARQRQQNTAAGPAGSRQRQQHGRRQQGGPTDPDDDDAANPYLHIVDPAAPRLLVQQRSAAAAAAAAAADASALARAAAAGQHRGSSSLPAELRRKLAEQAPLLPTGTHTMFWDSKTVPTFVSGHGLEVNNHWGAVDVHQELPADRVDELFMLPMPANHQRPQQRPPAQATHNQQQQQPSNKRKQPLEQASAGPDGQREGGSLQQEEQLQWPSRNRAWEGVGAAAGEEADTSCAAAAAGSAWDSRTAQRARRAEERAYNEAVIGAALSDEALARQVQEADAQQGRESGGRGGRGARGQGKKMSVKDRLASKLLKGSAVAAAVRDLNAAEGELRREKFGNRW